MSKTLFSSAFEIFHLEQEVDVKIQRTNNIPRNKAVSFFSEIVSAIPGLFESLM